MQIDTTASERLPGFRALGISRSLHGRFTLAAAANIGRRRGRIGADP
jgi:hypothetical protein